MAIVLWCSLLVLSYALSLRYGRGLNKFNGPFLASITDAWRWFQGYRKTLLPMRDLHHRYGNAVRVGPKTVVFSDPQALRDIYGAGKNWQKSDLYPVFCAVAKGRMAHTLFSSPDQTWHKNVRRAMNGFFTQTSVVSYEPLMDATVEIYLQELDFRFTDKDGGTGTPFDAFEWVSYFAFDVMSDMTYSQRHGFIQRGEDVHNIMHWVETFLGYGFLMGQMPWLDKLFRHNPLLLWLERRGLYAGNTFPGVGFALQRFGERERNGSAKLDSSRPDDLLDKFRRAKEERPEHITAAEVIALSLSTIIAGSEPTAVILTALLYYILRTPGCYSTLQREIDTHFPPNSPTTPSSYPPISQQSARQLPYLHACVQEAFRVHPSFGINVERVVPASGATIAGHFVPGGTVVGCSPGVIQCDKATFGEDVEVYRPDRWIEDAGNGERIRKMERTMFQFGAGNYTCLGKNIALMEIYKLVPSLMRAFEISMPDPEKEWKINDWANPRPTEFEICIKRRKVG